MQDIILACLFSVGKTLTAQELADACQTTTDEILYSISQPFPKPWCILSSHAGFRLAVDPSFQHYITRVARTKEITSLSKAALETLSLIAYRGPITKSSLEEIRGLNCALSIRSLAIKDLIVLSGDDEDPMISLSEKALQHLGIQSLQHLPDYAIFGPQRSLDEIINEGNRML